MAVCSRRSPLTTRLSSHSESRPANNPRSSTLVWSRRVRTTSVKIRRARDCLAVLRAADDPTDRISRVAALRSPLYAWADVDLLDWHYAGGRWNLRSDPPATSPPITRWRPPWPTALAVGGPLVDDPLRAARPAPHRPAGRRVGVRRRPSQGGVDPAAVPRRPGLGFRGGWRRRPASLRRLGPGCNAPAPPGSTNRSSPKPTTMRCGS